MNSLLTWFQGARWRLSLSHCLEALPIQVLVSLAMEHGLLVPTITAWIFGAIVVAFVFWSREKTQYEQEVKVPGDSNTTVWAKGYGPWEWSKESLLDWVFPVVSSFLVVLVVTLTRPFV